jgi:hypothetical protein
MTSRIITILLLLVLPSILFVMMITLFFIYFLGAQVIFFSFVLLYGINFFVYIPYYTRDKPEKYFKKIGFTEAAMEYQFSNKLFLIVIALSILFFVFIYLVTELTVIPFAPSLAELPNYQLNLILIHLLELTLVSSTAVVILAIRFILQRARKDFNFYLARAYFKVSSQQEDIVGKIRYLILTIDTYNKFLERNLKLKINDIRDIYSRIVSASAEEKIMIGESIGKALEKDKLELATQLRELFSSPDKEEEQKKFLTKEPLILNQQFKEILAAVIPAVITTVITVMLPYILRLPV